MSTPILEVRDLDVRYGEAGALFGVSLSLAAGAAVALLGANGAGKSSFAAAIAGTVAPTRGTISLDGTDVTGWAPHRIARLGVAYAPEGRGIFPHLSVADNLRVMLRNATTNRRELGGAVEHAITLFPVLGQRRKQHAGTLSGGEQQMLALARVLAVPPKLLVADEMSLGLAPKAVDTVFDGLAQARAAGVSVVLVEQYVERALEFADEAVILRHGEVAWAGSTADAHPRLVESYLGSEAT